MTKLTQIILTFEEKTDNIQYNYSHESLEIDIPIESRPNLLTDVGKIKNIPMFVTSKPIPMCISEEEKYDTIKKLLYKNYD